MRGATAVVGIGQTPLYKRGTSPDPEMKLCLRAIVAACEDAGIAPADVDGFVSYGSERHEGQKLMPALGTKELRFGALIWGHGGGIPGALGLAASAIVTGQAEVVAVYRSLAENSGGRLRVAVAQDDTAAQYLVNGMDGPVQICALRSQRMLEADGVPASTMSAMARAAYHHASNNPDAAAYRKPFDETVVEEAGEFLTFENLIAPGGRLPVNTSGGNLAEGFVHGMSLVTEAVRQIRGTSVNQVPDAALSLMTGGPGDSVVSSALLGSLETL